MLSFVDHDLGVYSQFVVCPSHHRVGRLSIRFLTEDASFLLNNDPGKKEMQYFYFFCYGVIRFPHMGLFSFSHIEYIYLQKGTLRRKIYFNSIFKGC